MRFYFVKRDLWGIKAGSVERFSHHKAALMVLEGDIEAFDPTNRKHATAPGAAVALEVMKAYSAPSAHKAVLQPINSK